MMFYFQHIKMLRKFFIKKKLCWFLLLQKWKKEYLMIIIVKWTTNISSFISFVTQRSNNSCCWICYQKLFSSFSALQDIKRNKITFDYFSILSILQFHLQKTSLEQIYELFTTSKMEMNSEIIFKALSFGCFNLFFNLMDALNQSDLINF